MTPDSHDSGLAMIFPGNNEIAWNTGRSAESEMCIDRSRFENGPVTEISF